MTEKGCDNCYYIYFDEKAYPCSLCIRGIERTDKWQPSKKTKVNKPFRAVWLDDEHNEIGKTEADRKDEPQTDYKMPYEDCEDCETHLKAQMQARKTEPQMGDANPIPLSNRVTHIKDEPQTERSE